MSAIRTLRTVRHLKPGQIAGQVCNRLRPLWERPAAFARRPAPVLEPCSLAGDLPAPGPQSWRADDLLAGRFRFLNQEGALGWPPADWQVPALSRLWQYNLHYFEWLWALDYPAARAIMLDWIARHPLRRGHAGWEPYPTSLRLMNWCALACSRFRGAIDDDPEFTAILWPSVYRQAEWLRAHLETHLLGNHLFENGAALAFAGTCFTGPDARRWLETGVGILRREIPEQMLPDGMHFERSPMYHVRITYLLALLHATGAPELMDLTREPLQHAQRALAHLCHPDGEIALFNDSAFGIYNPPETLLDLATAAEAGPWALPEAGYYGWRGENGDYLVVDAGPVGPDYILGHAHGDIFSFELTLRGQRVVVDGGVYDYVPGAMRAYCRSTRAHNTVEIAGQDQCEFWGAFRVARRGRPWDVVWAPHAGGFRLSGRHDGYRRLAGAPEHYRTITWTQGRRLQVQDRIRSRRAVAAVSRLHLHPRCRVESRNPREATIDYGTGTCRVVFEGCGTLSLEDSFYCPEFGRKEANVALAFTMEGKDSEGAITVVHE